MLPPILLFILFPCYYCFSSCSCFTTCFIYFCCSCSCWIPCTSCCFFFLYLCFSFYFCFFFYFCSSWPLLLLLLLLCPSCSCESLWVCDLELAERRELAVYNTGGAPAISWFIAPTTSATPSKSYFIAYLAYRWGSSLLGGKIRGFNTLHGLLYLDEQGSNWNIKTLIVKMCAK